jgi:excisionase family DNA binding protein
MEPMVARQSTDRPRVAALPQLDGLRASIKGDRLAEPSWLSTEQIAGGLGVTSEWVRRQIIAKRLPARRFQTGDRAFYRVRRDDLEAFLDRYTTGPDGSI